MFQRRVRRAAYREYKKMVNKTKKQKPHVNIHCIFFCYFCSKAPVNPSPAGFHPDHGVPGTDPGYSSTWEFPKHLSTKSWTTS